MFTFTADQAQDWIDRAKAAIAEFLSVEPQQRGVLRSPDTDPASRNGRAHGLAGIVRHQRGSVSSCVMDPFATPLDMELAHAIEPF